MARGRKNETGADLELLDDAAPLPEGLLDLEVPCDDCGNTGHVYNRQWDAWRAKQEAFKKAEAEGKSTVSPGVPPFSPESVMCPACRGVGGRPTELGRQILSFVRRHANTIV